MSEHSRAFAAPGKYVQGPDEILHLEEYTKQFGENVFVVIDGFLFNPIKETLKNVYKECTSNITCEKFEGEICNEEIERLLNIIGNCHYEVIVGIGGGKTLDTAKVLATKLDVATIIVPTAASTDAPTSAVSIVYTKEGVASHGVFHKKNPDLILMDTDIIAKAPVRLLISGMGDALATYFEARACQESNAFNYVGRRYKPTLAAIAIAKTCYETLMEDGLKAKMLAELQVTGKALENVIEANTLLSGLGFESVGCAGAHGIHDCLTTLDETHKYFHGEKVAFGTICQLILENRPKEEVEKVINFCINVGLPVTLSEIGISDTSREHLMKAAQTAAESDLLKSEPFEVNSEMIYGSLLAADAYGKKLKAK